MRTEGRQQTADPYREDVLRGMVTRAPLGFTIFLGCVAISAVFELLRFPERRPWMLGFAAGFVVLVVIAQALIRRRPERAALVLIGLVNLVGVALNVYHVAVHASMAMCMWTITGLLCVSALLFPWGGLGQSLASIGAVLSYPLHLEAGTVDPLTWGAGAAYLVVVVGLSVFGASLLTRYVRRDLHVSAALTEREARLQSYFDLSLVGTAIFTADGACLEVNDELCRMLGYERAVLLDLRWPTLLHPDDRTGGAALFARALSAGDGPPRRDLRCVGADGESRDAIVSARGLPGPGGAVDHVMVLVQDITDRKRAEAARERYAIRADAARRRAEDASRAKDTFLATVSHELRTPLMPIMTWSSVLRMGGVDPDTTSAALAGIERCARTQAKLIEDLLDVSRIVSGEWRLTLRPVELGPVIRAAVELTKPAADDKGVTLECVLPPEPLAAPGDGDRLQQVFANLLSNGVKFTPPGGRVSITLEAAGSHVHVTVRDTGQGIDPSFLPHVFEQFRQADSSPTRRQGGLGLGLAIVRALVDLHGGTVRAESRGEGLGAAFTVELPAAALDSVSTDDRSRRVPTGRTSLGGLHVLVVDDEPETTTAVGTLLASCGAEVRTAISAPEALDIVGEWPPDVLVSDIAMPGEDGYALLRKLRARRDGVRDVPVIALTAYAGPADREQLLAAGFQAHVAKPADPGELAAAIVRAADLARRPESDV